MRRWLAVLLVLCCGTVEGGERARAARAREAARIAAAVTPEPAPEAHRYLLEVLYVHTQATVDADGRLVFTDHPVRFLDPSPREWAATVAKAAEYGREGLWICHTLYPPAQVRSVRVVLYDPGKPLPVWDCSS